MTSRIHSGASAGPSGRGTDTVHSAPRRRVVPMSLMHAHQRVGAMDAHISTEPSHSEARAFVAQAKSQHMRCSVIRNSSLRKPPDTSLDTIQLESSRVSIPRGKLYVPKVDLSGTLAESSGRVATEPGGIDDNTPSHTRTQDRRTSVLPPDDAVAVSPKKSSESDDLASFFDVLAEELSSTDVAPKRSTPPKRRANTPVLGSRIKRPILQRTNGQVLPASLLKRVSSIKPPARIRVKYKTIYDRHLLQRDRENPSRDSSTSGLTLPVSTSTSITPPDSLYGTSDDSAPSNAPPTSEPTTPTQSSDPSLNSQVKYTATGSTTEPTPAPSNQVSPPEATRSTPKPTSVETAWNITASTSTAPNNGRDTAWNAPTTTPVAINESSLYADGTQVYDSIEDSIEGYTESGIWDTPYYEDDPTGDGYYEYLSDTTSRMTNELVADQPDAPVNNYTDSRDTRLGAESTSESPRSVKSQRGLSNLRRRGSSFRLRSIDNWLLTPQPSKELEDKLAASGPWSPKRFIGACQTLSYHGFWETMATLAVHVSKEPSLVDALYRVCLSSEVLRPLHHWATLTRGSPTVVALVSAMAHTRELPLMLTNLGLKAAAKCGDLEAAKMLFRRQVSASVQPDVKSYACIISVYGKVNQWEDAVDLLRVMQQRGVQPNVITYTTLMKACTNAGAYSAAVDVFHMMETEGVCADVHAYNSLMSAFARLPDWQRTWAVLGSMRRAGLQPDIVSYNTLLAACERCGEWPRVQELFERMKREVQGSSYAARPNKITYNTIITAAGRAGVWEEALTTYHSMLQAGFKPDKVTMSSLVSALDNAGCWELAIQIFEDLRRAGVRPNAYCYNATISALAKGAQATRAQELVTQMRQDGYSPDIFTYAPLIEAFGRAGLCEEAYVVWKDMQVAGVEANSYVYMALINACEKDNNWPKAVEVFYAMKESGVEVDKITNVARQIMYNWPQLLGKVPGPIITAARVVVDTGRAARSKVNEILEDLPQGL